MENLEEVAIFAAWCIGSAHGDFDPRVDAERALVLADPAVFAYRAGLHKDYQRQRAQEGLAIECTGDTFNERHS